MARYNHKPSPPVRPSAAWRPSQQPGAKGRQKRRASPLRAAATTLGALVLIFFAWRIHGRYVGASPYDMRQFFLGAGVFLAIAIGAAGVTVAVWKLGAHWLRRPGTRIVDRVASAASAKDRDR